ncbi:MAG: hypothetical protein CL565_02450 [Alphaproteobacteria bacterium]|nr:hypothetical protein [Alphaproteobacteria bacterium]|tara:strand:+ start:65 stop:754 length:690 start_codon:yes stop_codon:yes gene_type:complete
MVFINKCARKLKDLSWESSLGLSHFIQNRTIDYSNIDNVIKLYETNADIKKDRFKRYKLHTLVNLLNHYKPKNILELGGGASTTFLSQYADKNDAKVTTIETNAWWAKFIRSNVSSKVDVILCEAKGNAKSSPKELRFDIDLDHKNFDMVFIDGPGDKFPNIGKKEGVTMNGVELKNLPDVFIIDGRKTTVNYMQNHPRLQDYTYKPSDLNKKYFHLPDYDYFSVFEKK